MPPRSAETEAPIMFFPVLLLATLFAQSTAAAKTTADTKSPPAQSTVPAPGPLTKVYTGPGVLFAYPNNWEVYPGKGKTVFCPPAARIPKPDGSNFITHGAFLGLFQPTSATTLKQASEDLFHTLQQQEPGMHLVSEQPADQKGHQTYIIGYNNPQAASPFGTEAGVLVTVQVKSGIGYLLMFAPATEMTKYSTVFGAITDSAALVIEPAVDMQDHDAHVELVRRVVARLQKNQFQMPTFRVFIEDAEIINAYSLPEYNIVVIPSGIVHFLEDDEGELAFIIAHELGHVQDDYCKGLNRAAGGQITQEQSRTCESRADDIGVQFSIGANYNPYDAAASFGRMMMFTGETDPTQILLNRYTKDHPVDVDRIANLRNSVHNYCTRFPTKCPAFAQ
jgi:Zn-dependent protease with chaperone function